MPPLIILLLSLLLEDAPFIFFFSRGFAYIAYVAYAAHVAYVAYTLPWASSIIISNIVSECSTATTACRAVRVNADAATFEELSKGHEVIH